MLTDNKKVIWFFGCTFVGVFALTTLVGEREVRAKPNLNARVENVMWGGITDSPNPLKSPVLVVVSIRNSGSMPSVVDTYRLNIKLGGRDYVGKLQSLDKFQKVSLHPINGMCANYYGEDSLYEKTLNPIQVGASVTGIMIFTFQNLDSDILKNEDYPEYTLQFRDVTGEIHSVSDRAAVRNPSSLYIPGIRQDSQCSSLPPQ